MEDAVEWHDPLLITDASSQQQQQQQLLNSHIHYDSIASSRSSTSFNMEEHDDFSPNKIQGREMLGFSLTSPDLVLCAGSPDIPRRSYEDSPVFLKGSSIEVSLENGINGSEMKDSRETLSTANLFTNLQASREEDICHEPHFELPQPPLIEEESPNHSLPLLSINAGSLNGITFVGGIQFSEDECFSGGDTVKTDSLIGDGEGFSIYQTARFGNFVYHFKNIGSGFYMVDLYFAEIIFTDGPPGMRVFDVFVQEDEVVSCLDVYASVGANRPLVISDIKTQVKGEEGLLIRFEGIVGSPIVCGVSVKKDSASIGEVKTLEMMRMSHASECHLLKTDLHDGKVDIKFQNLQREHENQKMELIKTKKAMEELKKENELKSREFQEAWRSLKELQNELMRKSMHVGSLAFAIEGQVKEKSRWFSSLRDLTRKLKILKMDHIKLSEEALIYKNCLEDMSNMNSIIQSKLTEHVELHEDLKTKFIHGAKERKELYNKVLELKGNIRVFCRCRPLNIEEIATGASMAVDFEAAKDRELTVKSNGIAKKTFKFDAVFSPQADQADIFEETAPLATSVLDGYNVCIFAYGQTGTGKTFTMEGTDEARGVNYRTLEELFRIIEERKNTYSFEISVSVLEVYNEQIRDLLSESQPGVPIKRLEVKQAGEGTHHVPGLVEARVNNVNEVWGVLQTGSNARAVGSTNANEHSSRSHCIHCVMVKGENLLNGECTRSKLWLIDLAGSERIAKTEVQGERLKETQNINRSLSALGDVINALTTKSPHIPFRNSKLTHLLQDSLGGDSKTMMFVQISPNESDLNETLCSLNFASRVRGIELGPAKKQVDCSELVKYKQMVEKSKQDMKNKDFQLKKMEDTIHGLDMKIKEKDMKSKNLQDKIKELESQLLVERKLARQHVDTKIAEQQQLQHTSQELEEQSSTLTRRPPLATRAIGPHRTSNESKEQVNFTRPLTENNYYKLPAVPPSVDGCVKHNDLTERENNPEIAEQPLLPKRTGRASNNLTEKENNPEIAEQQLLPKRTGRASICTTAQRIYTEMAEQPLMMPKRTGRASICTTAHKVAAQAPRRSLLPLPSSIGAAKLPSSLLPIMPIRADKREEDDGGEAQCLPEPTHVDSPKELKVGSKMLSSILRRSLQKKIHMRSPMQQNMRRVGVNVGMEKVRVSIGSRGRMAHRVLGSARRATRETPKKPNQREKERGWYAGTSVRTGL